MAKRKSSSPSPDETSPPTTSTNYTVLARRYRPQQFPDLIGQEHVAQALTNAVTSNRVAHAYLFTGARGVGKTSTARILAKALNCEKGPTTKPCDQCVICQSISSGEDLDVLEIDGASNNKVDEVREIRQNVQFRPSRSRYKIYIIDEVHMLSTSAFNALLKTLEEPPAHVKFIFATTEVQKIPITILSRCQRFDFAGISVKHIAGQLSKIVALEKMEADQEALELVARRAGGSMRDAESLLDQLLAFGTDKLTIDQVHQILGTAHDDRVIELAQAALSEDPKTALNQLNMIADQGLDLSELVDQLIEYWRDLMVVISAGIEGQSLSISNAHQQLLQEQANQLTLDTILAGLDILVRTKERMFRNSEHARILVEMALVRLGRLGNLVSLSQLAQQIQNPGTGNKNIRPPANPPDRKESTAVSRERLTLRQSPEGSAKKKEPEERLNNGPVEVNSDTLPQIWEKVLQSLNGSLASRLDKPELFPAISGPNTLVIAFPSKYNLAYKHCEDPERVNQVQKTFQEITGHSFQIRIDLLPDDGNDQPSGVSTDGNPASSLRAQAEQEKAPLIQYAMAKLGAQVLKQDEGFGQPPEEAITENPQE